MLKMIVVDDEYLVRKGIKETIDWAAYNIEIIAEASNGEVALDFINELKPDIILSDVRMPVVDGLELSKRLSDDNYDGIIILLSGYSDFDYARKAIDCGVTSYLLKPVDNEELINVVRDASAKLKEKRKNAMMAVGFSEQMTLLKNAFLQTLFHGKVSSNSIKEQFTLFGITPIEKGILIYAKIDDQYVDIETQNSALVFLWKLIKSTLKQYDISYEWVENEIVLAVAFCDSKELANQIYGVIRKYEKNSGFPTVSIGISDTFDGLENIPEAYRAASGRAGNKIFPTINSVSYEDAVRPYKQIIIDAIEYITKNYSKSISIKTVANDLMVSESNLMHNFKDNLNKTFIECLTDFRMLKAKQLLREGRLRVNEIAYSVGYSDIKHFGQLFKKNTGMTPSEFAVKERKLIEE